ncbi:hypothetical protein HanOQP8_Chr03g0121091 [Helianthus annuus]|nr:hypothetical protein HanOQP8_Chr03g0121091 [Helianthus annuus]
MIGWRCLAKVRGTLHCPNPLVCECGVRLNCPKVVFFVLPFCEFENHHQTQFVPQDGSMCFWMWIQ